MALVNSFTPMTLERDAKHTEVACTYTVVEDAKHEKYLQLDTYGSKNRTMLGKKSQSIRLSRKAIEQLKTIFDQNGF